MNKNVQKRKRGFTRDSINIDVINAALDDILDGVDPSQALANALKKNNSKFDPEYIDMMKRAQWDINPERVKNLMNVKDSRTKDIGFQGAFGGQRKFDGSGRGIGNFGKMTDSLYKGQKITAIKDDQGVRAGEVYTVIKVEEPMSSISEPEDFNRETVYVLQDSSGDILTVTDCGGLFYNSKDLGSEATFENKQEAESYGQKLLEEGKISGFYTREKEGKVEVFTYKDSVASEEEPLKTKIEELIKNRDSARKLGYSGDQYQKEIDKLQKDAEPKEYIEAYGVKGVNSKPWRRTFKSQQAFENWLHKNEGDVEVHGAKEIYIWGDKKTKDATKEEAFQKATGMNAEQRQDFRNKVDVLLDKAEKLRKAGKENTSEYKKLQQEVMSLMLG